MYHETNESLHKQVSSAVSRILVRPLSLGCVRVSALKNLQPNRESVGNFTDCRDTRNSIVSLGECFPPFPAIFVLKTWKTSVKRPTSASTLMSIKIFNACHNTWMILRSYNWRQQNWQQVFDINHKQPHSQHRQYTAAVYSILSKLFTASNQNTWWKISHQSYWYHLQHSSRM